MSTRIRSYLACAALLAAVLGAFAPTITRVLGASRGVQLALAEICTSPGSRPAGDSSGSSHLPGESCPFCFGHSVSPAPPPASVQWVASVAPDSPPPFDSAHLPDIPQYLAHAQSRAPPLSS